jgi:hypothetical protein
MANFNEMLNVHSTHTRSPVKMEQTECSETSAFKTQTPGNYPKETIQQNAQRFIQLYFDQNFLPE